MSNYTRIHEVLRKHKKNIVSAWVKSVIATSNASRETEEKDCQTLLDVILNCLTVEPNELEASSQYGALEQSILSFTTYRVLNDFTPTQTAKYILSLIALRC